MAADSDMAMKILCKNTMGAEIISESGDKINLRIGLTQKKEERLWEEGGLTFKHNGLKYGSCDACFYIDSGAGEKVAIMAIELTDALNRRSSGNAQYQRFHHALGAVKNGVIGVYFLKEGEHPVRPENYAMALHAWDEYNTPYIISQDLGELRELLKLWNCKEKYNQRLSEIKQKMKKHYDNWKYSRDLENFAVNRGRIIFDDNIIHITARKTSNFTKSSQRAGHIACGEMYLSLAIFPDKHLYYLWPRMTRAEIDELNRVKVDDKEWSLLTKNTRVTLVTRDEIRGLSHELTERLEKIADEPLTSGSNAMEKVWKPCLRAIQDGLRDGSLSVF
tara:strand:- start:1337 stop:2338 length:1002 start_codon:yes stop_codon:yes gene_type:complete